MRTGYRASITVVVGATVALATAYGPAASARSPQPQAHVAQPHTSGDIVVNGSFEEPQLSPGDWTTYGVGVVPGWDPVNACDLELQNDTVVNAYDGNQYLELASNCVSGVTQTLHTVPGTTYRVTFVFRSRPDTDPSANTTSLRWGGKVFANLQGTQEWVPYSYDLTATSSSTVLEFDDTDPNLGDSMGDFFDAVSVVPTSTALLNQTISFPHIADHVSSDEPFAVTATGGKSGQPVTFLSTTPVTCSTTPDGTVTLTGSKGSCDVQASQAGSSQYRSAAPVSRAFAVTGPLVHVAVTGTQTYGGTWHYTHRLASSLPTGVTMTGTLTCTNPASKTSHPGTYAVTSANCHGLSVTAPYEVAYAGTNTVSPAVLTVTASSGTMAAGAHAPVIRPSYAGAVGKAAALTKAPTCGTTATAQSTPGVYRTVCSGAVSRDYEIRYVDGSVRVVPALPFSGSNTSAATWIGCLLLAAGGVLMYAGRRRVAVVRG